MTEDYSSLSPAPAPLTALIATWRERDLTLNRKADAQPSTMYAKTLADRAECYGRCADELEAEVSALSPQPPTSELEAAARQVLKDVPDFSETRQKFRLSATPLNEPFPCPLCGGPAYATRTVNGTQMFKVGCPSCGIELKAAWYRDQDKPTKDILSLWNTRGGSPQPPSERLPQALALMNIREWVDEGFAIQEREYGYIGVPGLAANVAAQVWLHVQNALSAETPTVCLCGHSRAAHAYYRTGGIFTACKACKCEAYEPKPVASPHSPGEK